MATLVINRSESYCADCKQKLGAAKAGAIPWEDGHQTYIGWAGEGKGCGRPWTAVSSDYLGPMFDNIDEHYFGWKNLEGLPMVSFADRTDWSKYD